MRPGRAADHSPPSSAAVMEGTVTSTHPLGHTGPVTGKLYFTLLSLKRVEETVHSASPTATPYSSSNYNVQFTH